MYRLAAAVWLAVSVLRAQVLPVSIQTQNCPASGSAVPPALTAPSDFVELSRSGCFGSCPAYNVRLHRDGRVEWDGQAYVSTEGEQRGSVSADAAYRLLEQFRSERFWSLCGRYSRLVSDSATVSLTATIAATGNPWWTTPIQRRNGTATSPARSTASPTHTVGVMATP